MVKLDLRAATCQPVLVELWLTKQVVLLTLQVRFSEYMNRLKSETSVGIEMAAVFAPQYENVTRATVAIRTLKCSG